MSHLPGVVAESVDGATVVGGIGGVLRTERRWVEIEIQNRIGKKVNRGERGKIQTNGKQENGFEKSKSWSQRHNNAR